MSTERSTQLNGAPSVDRYEPNITWDSGTAYDLFMSLEVLHDPEHYGLRASWAAGVRSRLSPDERKFLEELHGFLWVPLHWIHTLPAPKDAATALWALRQIPPAERPKVLLNFYELCDEPDAGDTLLKVIDKRAWDQGDLEILKKCHMSKKHEKASERLATFLDWLSRPDELGELYLSALQSYYQAFFAEEEKRIAPVLRNSLVHAQELAGRLPFADLLVELTQGVHFEEPFKESNLVLVPGYWNTPFVIFPKIGPDSMLILFGVRPLDMSLVPGEQVPDTLLLVLKALADPTRLKIMRYLNEASLTPSEIARRLRLRPPTVTHHLSALRLAGLVHLSLDSSGEKRYAARMEAIHTSCAQLVEFLTQASRED
jgi:DNA-binding transcriptional ArsR family regulator